MKQLSPDTGYITGRKAYTQGEHISGHKRDK